jgi:hypothetical protein
MWTLDNSDARADFILENTEDGHIFCTDVVVTHPPFDDNVIVNNDVALDVAVES